MRFASAATIIRDLDTDLLHLCQDADAQIDGQRPDLILVFFTSHFEDESATIVRTLIRRYPGAIMVGCVGESVIGGGAEHERVPAVAVMLASLPGATIRPIEISGGQIVQIDEPSEWQSHIGVDPADRPTFLFFGDPFTVPVDKVLKLFNQAYVQRPVFGGMASGCEEPGQAVLVIDDKIRRDGAVGIAMTGPIEIETVVSQGCRPIGQHLLITRCEGNIIHELGGISAMKKLQAIVQDLRPEDVNLARQALFVGRVINEYQEQFTRGDFLIRNLLGIDPDSGAIAVSEQMRVGGTIQFHVRDHVCADEDMRQILAGKHDDGTPSGAMLFSCSGRGTRMWPEPNHDVGVIREVCGTIPVTGFFAAGEIGPVAGQNFLHSHTASIALFRQCPNPQP